MLYQFIVGLMVSLLLKGLNELRFISSANPLRFKNRLINGFRTIVSPGIGIKIGKELSKILLSSNTSPFSLGIY